MTKDMNEFEKALKLAGVNKSQLAKITGISASTIYHWKDKPPHYIAVLLQLMCDSNVMAEKISIVDTTARALIDVIDCEDVGDNGQDARCSGIAGGYDGHEKAK